MCATVYTLSTGANRFDELIQCYTDMGFTEPCATMWAHLGAANTIECGAVCLPDSTGVTKLNEDPPTCEFAPCLQCSEAFQADFDTLAGRTLYNSGITERIVRTCDSFSRIEHEHCVGTTEIGDSPCANGPSPTPAPNGGGGGGGGSGAATTAQYHSTMALLVGLGGLAMLMNTFLVV